MRLPDVARQATRAVATGKGRGVLKASAHPDARHGLSGGIRGIAAVYGAHRDVFRVLYSMAELDAAAVGDAVQRMEQGRAQGMNDLARRLDEQRALRRDVTTKQAADTLWLLTSFESFDLLHLRGLSIGETATALIYTAERTLCC